MRRLALFAAMAMALPLVACGSKGPSEADIESVAKKEVEQMLSGLGLPDGMEIPTPDVDNVSCEKAAKDTFTCTFDTSIEVMGQTMEESNEATFKKVGGEWTSID